jgi:oligosaccharide repeat unit polymerase
LLPPLAGAILAQRQRYSAFSKLFVVSVLLLTLFMGFAGGTRNVFITYVITFVAAYLLIKPRLTWKKALSAGLPAVLLCIFATYQMLQVRTVGIGGVDYEEFSSPIAIDYNLVNISRLTEVFPDKHAYLGLEIPYQALIRPIPRAIWPGKPTGLSLGIEEALGAEGLTLAVSFIGEMYMSGGYIAIIVASILFGALAAKWNRMGNNLNSNIRLIVFASGFFAAGLTMRSFLSAAPTLLPTLALYLYTRRKEKRAQSLQRARALRNQ